MGVWNSRTHGMTGTRLFRVWSGMWERCTNPHHSSYHLYGGRGISVCSEWKSFEVFRAWALEQGYDESAPRGAYTLDRVETDGNYSPDNCRFATDREQANNKRNNRRFTMNGETHTAAEWARITGVTSETIRARVDKLGWPVERALTTPCRG